MHELSNIHINGSDLAEAISTSTQLTEELSSSLADIKTLESLSQGSDRTWTGQSKEICLMYLDILIESHKELEKIVKNHQKTVKKLKKDIKAYDEAGTMSTIRSI